MRKIISTLVLSAALIPAAAFAADKADISALRSAKISMRDAIMAAEKTGAGKAVDVTFDDDKGGIYDVTVVAGDKPQHYTVSATTSTATAMKSTEMTDKISDKVSSESKGDKLALATAKLSLSDAVAKAETSAGGKAIGAELKTHNKLAVYDVDVVGAGDKVMQVSVDSKTGAATTKN